MLSQQLEKETTLRKDLNHFTEEDLQDVLYGLEGDPGSMVVISPGEGSELEVREGALRVKGKEGGVIGVAVSKNVKKSYPVSFSMNK